MIGEGIAIGGYSEDTLIEQPTIALFGELGWATVNCFNETFGPAGTLGRETKQEVVLATRLRDALCRLNPNLPAEAIEQAVEELTRDRSALSPAHANQEVYKLLKEGVEVTFRGSKGETTRDRPGHRLERAREQRLPPGLAVLGHRRASTSGGPISSASSTACRCVFIELKSHAQASRRRLSTTTSGTTRTPSRSSSGTTPSSSCPTAARAAVGSVTADWEHFADWKRINDEGEQGVVSLETSIRGTCEQHRLLDLVENFTALRATPTAG